MLYYRDENLIIRDMAPQDAERLAAAERLQGWHVTAEKYNLHIRDRQEERCVSMVAELSGEPVGYVNLYWEPESGPFAGMGLPEIVDFGVLEKARRNGIGTKLMDAAESLAAEEHDFVTIGVGLHEGYGAAQRMYVLRGYVPDGSGVWYAGKVWPQYENFCNDDDLVLYMSKCLKQGGKT